MKEAKRLYTVRELAEAVGMNSRTLHRWLDLGQVPIRHASIGSHGSRLFAKADVDLLVRSWDRQPLKLKTPRR